MKIILANKQAVRDGYVRSFRTKRDARHWLRISARIFLSYTIERVGSAWALYGKEVIGD